ncbi:MAG: hypothetical protein R3Y27_04785 [Clostridia bacterium]
MAVNYVTQKCTSCAGTKLEFEKEHNAWRCKYCGTLIERQEQVDTMFTIKNVVRQSILDVAYSRMDNAQNNIVECEKIDTRYVGTLIAKIAYEMTMIMHDEISENEQRNMFSLLKKNYMELNSISPVPTEEEIILYEFFDSAEIMALLILVYDSLNAHARRDYLYKHLDASAIYSVTLNSYLLNYAFKQENMEILDQIISNADNIDVKETLLSVFEKYPDGEKKREYISALLNIQGYLVEDDKNYFEQYLRESEDSIETKILVTELLSSTCVSISVECVLSSIIVNINDVQSVSKVFDIILNKKLFDVEIEIIIDFAIKDACDEICLYILDKFNQNHQFIDFSYNYFMTILKRKSGADKKQQIIEAALKFNVGAKTKEAFVSSYLNEVDDPYQNRVIMLKYLLTLIDSLSINSVEKYLFKCSIDGKEKQTIVKMIFKMKINKSFFRNTLSDYLKQSNDNMAIKNQIIQELTSIGLEANTESVIFVLFNAKISCDDKINVFRLLKANGLNIDDVANSYLSRVSANNFESHVFCALLADAGMIKSENITRYLIIIKDVSTVKAINIQQMSRKSYTKIQDLRCSVKCCNSNITCNLAQGYMLASPDQTQESIGVLDTLKNLSCDIGEEIQVNGSRCKIKKYINSQKNNLNDKAKQLCIHCKLL